MKLHLRMGESSLIEDLSDLIKHTKIIYVIKFWFEHDMR